VHRVVTPAAIVALLINLTAAGGISFAGVACTLWLLVALTLNQAEGVPRRMLSQRLAIGLATACIGATFLFWPPVSRRRSAPAPPGRTAH